MIKKENKKVTMKAMFKKMTLAASLTLALAAPALSAAQTPVRAATSAHQFSATKYFPGENENTDNPYPSSADEAGKDCYFRDFKNKSANIYVKDKELLPVMKKAAKAWSPVFKFKFVKSGKHANFNSSKYANIIVYNDPVNEPGQPAAFTTVNRVLENPKPAYTEKIKKSFLRGNVAASKYNTYFWGYITNWKLRKAALESNNISADGTSAGYWKPSLKDARKNTWTHHLNMIMGTDGLDQAHQILTATEMLGEIIGLEPQGGTGDNYSIMDYDSSDRKSDVTKYYVTQTDLDHVNWVYAHPWSGTNKFWNDRSLLD